MQEKNTIDQLKAIISEREKKVKLLENQLEFAKQSQMQPNENFFLNNENFTYNQNESDLTRIRPPSSSNSFIKPKTDNSLFNERDSSRYLGVLIDKYLPFKELTLKSFIKKC